MRHCALVVAGALAVSCSQTEATATWPAGDDDVVIIMTAPRGSIGLVEGVFVGRPIIRQELSDEGQLFAVVLTQEQLRRLHPSLDLSPTALTRLSLVREFDQMCEAEVSADGADVTVDFPQAQVFEFDRARADFVASAVALETLVGSRKLRAPLGPEICRIQTDPAPFPMQGELRSSDDSSDNVTGLHRLDADTLLVTTKTHLYVVERGQPSRSLRLIDSETSDLVIREIAVHREGDGSLNIVLGLTDKEVSTPSGGFIWVQLSGDRPGVLDRLQLRFSLLTPQSVHRIAMRDDGRFVGVSSLNTFYFGTATSSAVIQQTEVAFEVLREIQFTPDGRLLFATRSLVASTTLDTFGEFFVRRLIEGGNAPANSSAQGLAVVGDDIFVATISKGIFRFGPQDVVKTRLDIGIAQPKTLCVLNRSCGGADFFRSNAALGVVPRPDGSQWLFLSNNACPLLAIYELKTNCTSEISLAQQAAALEADELGVIFAVGTELFELPASEFPDL